MTDMAVRVAPPRRMVSLTVDGEAVDVPEGSTLLEACRSVGCIVPAGSRNRSLRSRPIGALAPIPRV